MIEEWVQRWQIPAQAIAEFRYLFTPLPGDDEVPDDGTEGDVQNNIRIAAAEMGHILWRNNSGAATTDTGSYIRFGLGNDSKKLNKTYKSPDLVGIRSAIGNLPLRPMLIEVKEPGWRYKGTERELGQLRFMQHASGFGALCGFCQSVDDFRKIAATY